jgi:uncharacterized repeat protein (TIGR03806 family)
MRTYLLPLIALLSTSLLAQEKKQPPTVECRFATGRITIDGKADEPAWQQAEPIDNFGRPWLPESERKTKTTTKARVLWDKDNLYIFADLEDHDLYADLLNHDDRTWLNDVFEMFFRPDDTKPPYYELQVNAAGTLLDIYFKRKGTPFDEAKVDGDFHWEAKVIRRGTLDNRTDRDEGWTAECRIPWTDFSRTGGRPTEGDVWRFALCRYDYTLNEKPETSTAAPLSQPSFHLLEDYSRLKFVGLKTGAVAPRPGLPTQAFVTTSKVIGSPDPPLPYKPVRAFPKLKLNFPIALDLIPGTDQFLCIVQGKSYAPSEIVRIRDDPNNETAEPVLTTPASGTAYGIAFHPRFADNGYLYVGWNGAVEGKPKRTIITRYTLDRSTYTIDPATAFEVIAWESGGHNGGDLDFGLDGMLYITSGDGTSDSDTNLRGQDLTQLTAKVLRIDVDHPAEGKQYSVPSDNPFVGIEGVVPETWAYGLRNPWRITVDRKTGHIWVGNNGQDLWEQVYFVTKGANFGWSVYEGSQIFYANRKMGPQPLTPPVADHHHSEARSLTGGVVYHGTKLPELTGAYIYGDHSTGRIWGIRHDGTKVTWHKLLSDTTFNITGFAIDSHGELLVADHRGEGEGGYYYLEQSPPQTAPSTFPKKLSDSGLLLSSRHAPRDVPSTASPAQNLGLISRSEMATLVTAPGVIPYSVNSPLWSDGAYKERHFAIPQHAASNFKIDLAKKNGWDFPNETVLIKSFALETTPGDPGSRRWIETRFFTKQDNEWAGYSYRWNDDQTDAELVSAAGLDENYTVAGKTQTWHFPSRVECMVCHSRAANFVLGLSTAQMNKDHDYGGTLEHQFRVLEQLDLLKKPADPEKLAKIADPADETQPLEARARSYLHANCAICHINAGGGNAQMDMEYTASLKKLNAIDVDPLHHKFGLDNPKLIAPGHPDRSVLFHRLSHRGPNSGQMPQLGTNLVDETAVKLFDTWIRSLTP